MFERAKMTMSCELLSLARVLLYREYESRGMVVEDIGFRGDGMIRMTYDASAQSEDDVRKVVEELIGRKYYARKILGDRDNLPTSIDEVLGA
jgi:hypothetical protein